MVISAGGRRWTIQKHLISVFHEFIDRISLTQPKKSVTETKWLVISECFCTKNSKAPGHGLGLNRHSSNGGSGGNLGAEICYHIWPSIAVGECRNSDFCPEIDFLDRNRSPTAPSCALAQVFPRAAREGLDRAHARKATRKRRKRAMACGTLIVVTRA